MRKIISKKFILGAVLLSVIIFGSLAHSHCQVPCGIYDDKARFNMIAEHITTIEKSMKMIEELSAQEKPNMNQLVRWINNKDVHADEISHIVSYYFLTQRVKPAEPTDTKAYNKYVNKLALLHQMLVYSMKTKQTTDLNNIEKLRTLLSRFHEAYFGKPMQHEHEP
jgi:nickel superoxide dismutase